MDPLRTFCRSLCLLAALPVAALAGAPEPIMSRPAMSNAAADADPLDRLRERLAEKLGATKAPDSANPNELRVTSRSTGGPRRAAEPGRPDAAATPARAR